MWTLSLNKLPIFHSASYCSQPHCCFLYSRLFCSVGSSFFVCLFSAIPHCNDDQRFPRSRRAANASKRRRRRHVPAAAPLNWLQCPCSPSVSTACERSMQSAVAETGCGGAWRLTERRVRSVTPSRRQQRESKDRWRWVVFVFFLFFFWFFTSSVVIAVQYTGPGTTSMKCEVGVDETVYRDKEKKIKLFT